MSGDKKPSSGCAVLPCETSAEIYDTIDDQTVEIFTIIQYCVICTLVNCFGITTNIINILVFWHMGFKESINISLLGLSISDGCSLLAFQWMNVCFGPVFKYSDIPILPFDVVYLTGVWPRQACTRITAWITAFITFERCLCIALPLKVNTIFTPAKTGIIITFIYFFILATVAPTYYTSRLAWKFVAEKNRTLLGTIFTEDRQDVDSVVFGVCSVCLPIISFGSVLICTVILSLQLGKKTKWRQTMSANTDLVSRKDKKVVKMVSLISTIFIICFFPNTVGFTANILFPELNLDGKLRNTGLIVGWFIFFLESINSCTNIFVYLKMSTKFRDKFNRILKTESYTRQYQMGLTSRGICCTRISMPSGHPDELAGIAAIEKTTHST